MTPGASLSKSDDDIATVPESFIFFGSGAVIIAIGAPGSSTTGPDDSTD